MGISGINLVREMPKIAKGHGARGRFEAHPRQPLVSETGMVGGGGPRPTAWFAMTPFGLFSNQAVSQWDSMTLFIGTLFEKLRVCHVAHEYNTMPSALMILYTAYRQYYENSR